MNDHARRLSRFAVSPTGATIGVGIAMASAGSVIGRPSRTASAAMLVGQALVVGALMSRLERIVQIEKRKLRASMVQIDKLRQGNRSLRQQSKQLDQRLVKLDAARKSDRSGDEIARLSGRISELESAVGPIVSRRKWTSTRSIVGKPKPELTLTALLEADDAAVAD